MVYTCQHCGAWFPKDLLGKVMESGASSIVCPYCDLINEISRVQESHVARGYDHLADADFYLADAAFAEALKQESVGSDSFNSKFLDVYLGRALAAFSVQVIYNDKIADDTATPEINCYECNSHFFEESGYYIKALQIAKSIPDNTLRSNAIARVTHFAKTIDGIKKVYDRKTANGDEYQLFIAREDYSKDAEAGLLVANKIRDNMPDAIKRIFVQDMYGLDNEEYEGELLYAIHHSNCMLVVVDDDIDARLMNLYYRYYWAMKTDESSTKNKALGFVSYKNGTWSIQLPEHKISHNVFELDDPSSYRKFVLEANRIFVAGYEPIRVTESTAVVEDEQDDIESSGNNGAPYIKGKICRFGSYPQRRVMDEGIISAFTSEPKPTMSSPNGWEIMFRSKSGQPYTWYKDKVIGSKKYRAVYFMKFREVFTVRNSDIAPSLQRVSNYTPMRIYVFSFDDIEWNILDIARSSVTLVASVGLDCREFNGCQLCGDWDCSSVREWLNNEFYNTAFTEEQKEFIWRNEINNDRIAIPSVDRDINKESYCKRFNSYNILGSDYFKCIGGFCDRNISNFWVDAPTDYSDRAAVLQPHEISTKSIVAQCVDNTAVSVLPLIIVNLEEK